MFKTAGLLLPDFAGCVYDCPTGRTTDTTVMVGKLIALAILLVIFYILYRQYKHCKDGTGRSTPHLPPVGMDGQAPTA